MGPGSIVLLTSLAWGLVLWLMGKTGYGKGYKRRLDHRAIDGRRAGKYPEW